MSFVQGFGGMRIINNQLNFSPVLPEKWDGYSFRIKFRDATIKMEVDRKEILLENFSSHDIRLGVYGKELVLAPNGKITTKLN
jgi:maltose phosphorylase